MNGRPIDIEESKNFIRTHARSCEPNEACGIIIKVGNKQEVICAHNVALNPRHTFVMNPADYAAAEDRGEVLAIYHSHYNEPPTPSVADMTLAERHQLPVIIVSWPADTWDMYSPQGFKADLVGRPFVYGVLDCLTLIRDYYKETHDIDIPDYSYTPEFWKRGENLYEENLPKQGFTLVSGHEIKTSDIILMQLEAPIPNHSAIYTGDGMMLHHPPDHLSGYHPYLYNSGYYAKCTVGIYRHKQLMMNS